MTSFIASPEVADALATGKPVVALESTIISHGLPRPRNLEAAKEFEQILRSKGVVPATIAILDGVPRIGLDEDGINRIANEDLAKASVRDIPILAARKDSGATTVAATAHLASLAGIRVFATGGLGGVHRGAQDSFDESADLGALGKLDIAIVCAGVKSILDVGATLERLESLSIGLVGYQTHAFPGFYLTDSGFTLEHRVESASEIAAIIKARRELKTDSTSLIVANPVKEEMDRSRHDAILASGLAGARVQGITGKAVTPFLLEHFHTASQGESLTVNIEIIKSNSALAADIAVALTK